jgi:RNA polymerase sigma-70 factor, ECF subfamily
VPETDRQNVPDWPSWLDRHQTALLLLARQYLATREEAQDALQDGFVRFWQTRSRARNATAYLFTCVRSAAMDLRRARLARKDRERAVAATAESLLTGPAELEDRRQGVEAALATLPEDQREVLVMKVWSELTFAEIAEALHIPANTAASRYRYALGRLQTLLASEVTHD